MSEDESKAVQVWMDEHGDDPNVQEFLYLAKEIEKGLWELQNWPKKWPGTEGNPVAYAMISGAILG